MEGSSDMDSEYNVFAIAECVLNWGISDARENPSGEIIYDSESLECLDNIATTAMNFSYSFEMEMHDLFRTYCNKDMTPDEFIDFATPRCDILGQCKGYFGYILPCTFMREIISRFKSAFNCSELVPLAEECLAKFLNDKFKEFGGDCSWDGLMAFCKDINQKFEKYHASEKTASGCLSKETMADSTIDKVSVPTTRVPVASDTMETDAPNKDTNCENYKCELPDGASASKSHSNAILNLSKEISELRFGDNNELGKIEENEAMDSISESNDQLQETDDSEDDEMHEINSMLMPDEKTREEILEIIYECFELENEANSLEVDENCAFKSNSDESYKSEPLNFNHE